MRDYTEIINLTKSVKFSQHELHTLNKDMKLKQERIRKLYNDADPLTKNIVNTFIYTKIKRPILEKDIN